MKQYTSNELYEKHWFFKYCLNAKQGYCDNRIMYMYGLKYFKELIFASMINTEESNKNSIKEILTQSGISYNLILEKFKILSKELNLENSLELSLLYTYLLWNGYFSKDKKLNYRVEDRLCIPGCYAYDIMHGGVTCLNVSDMLKDVLNTNGYSSSILLSKTDKSKNIKKDYVPNIERNVKKIKLGSKISSLFLNLITGSKGDHAFTLIQENKGLYIYDATNLVFLKLDKVNSASIICGKGNFELKTYLSYMINDSSSRIALDNLNIMLEFSSPYNRKEYILTSENCIDLFKCNKNLLDDYHEEINNDIGIIVNETNCYLKNKRKILKSLR